MSQQASANSAPLNPGPHIRVPNQRNILHRLNTHHARKRPGLLAAPEHHAGLNLVPQLFARHVRLGPAVLGNDALIFLRAIVDDFPHGLEITLMAWTDYGGATHRVDLAFPI